MAEEQKSGEQKMAKKIVLFVSLLTITLLSWLISVGEKEKIPAQFINFPNELKQELTASLNRLVTTSPVIRNLELVLVYRNDKTGPFSKIYPNENIALADLRKISSQKLQWLGWRGKLRDAYNAIDMINKHRSVLPQRQEGLMIDKFCQLAQIYQDSINQADNIDIIEYMFTPDEEMRFISGVRANVSCDADGHLSFAVSTLLLFEFQDQANEFLNQLRSIDIEQLSKIYKDKARPPSPSEIKKGWVSQYAYCGDEDDREIINKVVSFTKMLSDKPERIPAKYRENFHLLKQDMDKVFLLRGWTIEGAETLSYVLTGAQDQIGPIARKKVAAAKAFLEKIKN